MQDFSVCLCQLCLQVRRARHLEGTITEARVQFPGVRIVTQIGVASLAPACPRLPQGSPGGNCLQLKK
jgi:hypothetical protein